jgi:DNA-binding Lrp family transcriptional regulator
MPDLDALDQRIVTVLRGNGRISNADLALAVGLSPSACLRRVRRLEVTGVIQGYVAVLDARNTYEGTVVFVQIALERHTEDALSRFESAVRRCKEVRECYLMTGVSDYQLKIVVGDMADYEKVHRDVLAGLPGVARIQSNFSIRTVFGSGREAKEPRRWDI